MKNDDFFSQREAQRRGEMRRRPEKRVFDQKTDGPYGSGFFAARERERKVVRATGAAFILLWLAIWTGIAAFWCLVGWAIWRLVQHYT